MRFNRHAIAAICLPLAGLAAASTGAMAQETGSVRVGGTTFTFGAGTALMFVPDIDSMMTRTTTTGTFTVFETFKFSDDFYQNTGFNLNGGLTFDLEGTGQGPDAVALSGFWARVDGNEKDTCTGSLGPQTNCLITPLVDIPATQQITGTLGANTMGLDTDRTINAWGGALEARWSLAPGAADHIKASNSYLAFGADVRGFYQDLSSSMSGTIVNVRYNEDLNTNYFGAFAAYGRDYSPFLLGALWDKLGLESSFRLQAGVYYARTDYSGTLSQTGTTCAGCGDVSGSLSLDSNDVSFIGGLTLETRKRFSPRTTLSLTSNMELNSFVPKMEYNQTDLGAAAITAPERRSGTSIDSGVGFSMRSMLRLSIKLGPNSMYQ
ncbi:hypothetical protein [Roseibium aestuarii]|uniref:Uncharacterized protein n=1 Tax=Roseibium aestuarii TaxID=2600299 RepID=A0ABW4JXA1_9HYPH|nr:hypothetical protein [Roseibium aestuarii]